MKICRFFMVIFFIFLLMNIGEARADTQNDISPQDAVLIIKNYEKAYMDKDLNKMLEYVDQNSAWFKKGFLEEFKAVFSNFTNINLFHSGKKQVLYVEDGIEVLQHTLYVAYSSTLTDINELMENYYLKKVDGRYRISECLHLSGRDVYFFNIATEAMLNNDINKAILNFKKAAEVNTNNSAAHFRLGMIYSKLGKYTESLEELKKAVELRPNVGFFRLSLSQVYKQLGEHDEALKELETAISLDSGILKTLVKK